MLKYILFIIFFSSKLAFSQLPLTNYFSTIIQQPSFPESFAYVWDIHKEKTASVDFEEKDLIHLYNDYSHNSDLRAKYPNRDDFISMVQSNVLASTNRIFHSADKLMISKHGRLLQTSHVDNQPQKMDALQIQKNDNSWESLIIDHNKKSAYLQSGNRGINPTYLETGLMDGEGRILLITMLRSIPDMDIPSAINALCSTKFLESGNRSLSITEHSQETPPYYLLTYRNTSSSMTIEYQLRHDDPLRLLRKTTTSPSGSVAWIYNTMKTNINNSMFPHSAHMIRRNASGEIVEQEWRTLEKVQPISEWNIQQLWANKLSEISSYIITQ